MKSIEFPLDRVRQSFFYQQLLSWFSAKRLPYVLIFFGVVVRLIQYFSNRSLWTDEAKLALNIVNRSYAELLQPLDYRQGAPLGFLMAEKLSTQIFGNNELALRLFPLICGIVSLVLLFEIGKRCLSQNATTIALALFTGLTPYVYYASEAKQYSTDVAVALAATLLVLLIRNRVLPIAAIPLAGIAGAILIWFSHPAVFTLAGLSAVCLFGYVRAKDWQKLLRFLGTGAFWAASFLGFYLFTMSSLSNSRSSLASSWGGRGGFMPLPPLSASDFGWFPQAFVNFFSVPLFNLAEPAAPLAALGAAVAMPAFLIGVLLAFRDRWQVLALLLAPIAATLLASGLEKYPFSGRLILFLAPFVLLVVAEGVEYLRQNLRVNSGSLAGAILLTLLLAQPIVSLGARLVRSIPRQEIKPVLEYVREKQQPGDTLYVYHRSEYPFKFYANQYGFSEGGYRLGAKDLQDDEIVTEADWKNYQQDLNQLIGKNRVWILASNFGHVETEKTLFDLYLDSIGKPLDSFKAEDAEVKLYDFSQTTR